MADLGGDAPKEQIFLYKKSVLRTMVRVFVAIVVVRC